MNGSWFPGEGLSVDGVCAGLPSCRQGGSGCARVPSQSVPRWHCHAGELCPRLSPPGWDMLFVFVLGSHWTLLRDYLALLSEITSGRLSTICGAGESNLGQSCAWKMLSHCAIAPGDLERSGLLVEERAESKEFGRDPGPKKQCLAFSSHFFFAPTRSRQRTNITQDSELGQRLKINGFPLSGFSLLAFPVPSSV